MIHLPRRPRRNRKTESIRDLVRETILAPGSFVLPLFVQDGRDNKTAIPSLKDCFRLSPDLIVEEAKEAYNLGIRTVALFPVIAEKLKDKTASESKNSKGLLPQTVLRLKNEIPEITVITDVAMDPYSSDGHDGIVRDGEIVNDDTLRILAEMALTQAQAGADIVAPSDMMDGRVGYIRTALDQKGYTQTGILSYTAKYASALYGPFRDALGSAPKFGDKKTYQMDPANAREALREANLDAEEGADILMVKPALAYLDIIAQLKAAIPLPIAAYQVSGEYAMIQAAAEKGWLDFGKVLLESLLSIKRAGADIIFTYGAKQAAEILN